MRSLYYHLCVISVVSLLSCSKETREGPYVPWNPGGTDNVEVPEGAEIVITEQGAGRILILEAQTGKPVWSWTPSDSGFDENVSSWFALPSEAKPVKDSSCLLITASRGGVCLIRISDKKALFYANPGGNPHSAEILPDGNIVVASSTGNKLSLYRYDVNTPFVSTPLLTRSVTSGHNVVWDSARNCLWTAAGGEILKFEYVSGAACDLKQIRTYEMPSGNTEAHDLVPVYGQDALYVTTVQNVYRFDCTTGEFSSIKIFQRINIKSISSGPESYPVIVSRPNSGSWWTTDIRDLDGNLIFENKGYQIYKARWFLDNPFSYND